MRFTWQFRATFCLVGWLALSPCTPLAADLPHRWINARYVRLRFGPTADAKVSATLQRGSEVELKQQLPGHPYCMIGSPIHYGYVACEYLSAVPVAHERAGEGGVAADARWVAGSGVTLRAEGRQQAAVLGRLGLNRRVRLLSEAAAGAYCEVQSEQGERGFTACRYLAERPVDELKLYSPEDWQGQPNADYDPARLFWMAPSWPRMEIYAQALTTTQRDPHSGERWPRDGELQKVFALLRTGFLQRDGAREGAANHRGVDGSRHGAVACLALAPCRVHRACDVGFVGVKGLGAIRVSRCVTQACVPDRQFLLVRLPVPSNTFPNGKPHVRHQVHRSARPGFAVRA